MNKYVYSQSSKAKNLIKMELRIAVVHSCKCGTYERCACLTEEAQSGKSPTENDQLGARSGSPRAVMAYLGCCRHCGCLLSPIH